MRLAAWVVGDVEDTVEEQVRLPETLRPTPSDLVSMRTDDAFP